MQEMKFRVYNKKLKKWYDEEHLILCNGKVYENAMDFKASFNFIADDIVFEWYASKDDNDTTVSGYTFIDTSVEDKKGVIFDTEEEAECMAFRYLKDTESEKDDIHIVKIMKD